MARKHARGFQLSRRRPAPSCSVDEAHRSMRRSDGLRSDVTLQTNRQTGRGIRTRRSQKPLSHSVESVDRPTQEDKMSTPMRAEVDCHWNGPRSNGVGPCLGPGCDRPRTGGARLRVSPLGERSDREFSHQLPATSYPPLATRHQRLSE